MPQGAVRSQPHLTDQDRQEVARAAATLDECLGRVHAPALTSDEARRVLRAWSEAFSPGDAKAFARRLGWDGLNEALVVQALTEPAPRETRLPEWTAWLDRFLDEAAALAAALESAEVAADLARVQPSPEPPFLEVWVSMARAARRTIADSSLGGVPVAAYAAFEQGLVRELAGVGELALFDLFRRFKDAAAGSAGPRYPAFLRRLLEGGLADVFKTHPVLARQFALLAATWSASTAELFGRLRSDRDAIAATFGADSLGELCGARCGLSDRHGGGRTVSVLTFTSGLSVVYKPRDVGLETAFERFQATLSSRGLAFLPKRLRILERDGYGWVEFVDQERFESAEQVRDYFRRAGTLLCLLHVLRGTDAHQENVVATRQGPALIDAEMLLQPVDRGEEADASEDVPTDAGAHGVPRSCLSSGFVTLLDVDADGNGYDVGGLMPAVPRSAAAGERSWSALRSDDLHFLHARTLHPAARNQLVLDGVAQAPARYSAELRSGFTAAYRFFLAERAHVLAPEGPLSLFAAQRSRLLFRPSDQYGACLHALAAPRYQRRGLERSAALETMNRVFRHAAIRPRLWPLVAEERRSLEELDVPLYLLPVDACVLRASGGEAVDGHLVRSGMDAVAHGLRALSEADLTWQLELLDSALEATAPHVGAQLDRAAPQDADVDRRDPAASWVRGAEMLGELILARARAGAGLTLAWSDCDARGPHGRYDLYRGQAGVGVFLAALATVTGREAFAAAARATLRPLGTILENERDPSWPGRWSSIGACSGLGSVVYALASAARLLGDSTWTELAHRWAREISGDRIGSDVRLDVAGGAAGALLALMALDDSEVATSWIRDTIQACARRLLAAQVATGDGSAAWPGRDGQALAGFAHGAAGIAYALGRTYLLTGDVELREAARRAHRYERATFSPAVRNWPVAQAGGVSMTAWCHGAPGIGLARTLGLDAFREDDEILEEIGVAMETTADAPPSRMDHLCCGDMGRSDALLTMGMCLHHAHRVADAQAIATRVAERACTAGGRSVRTEGFEHRTFHPGFFRGVAGIGYQLLRTAVPDRLPSILGFESGRLAQ